MFTDPIADMLTRIRNACLVQHRQVAMPSSKMKVSIAKILVDEGFVKGYNVVQHGAHSTLVIELKYTGRGDSVITGLDRVSRPGRRTYTGYRDIPWVRSGLGITIVSTPQGLMTGRHAKRAKLGGELVCTVW